MASAPSFSLPQLMAVLEELVERARFEIMVAEVLESESDVDDPVEVAVAGVDVGLPVVAPPPPGFVRPTLRWRRDLLFPVGVDPVEELAGVVDDVGFPFALAQLAVERVHAHIPEVVLPSHVVFAPPPAAVAVVVDAPAAAPPPAVPPRRVRRRLL